MVDNLLDELHDYDEPEEFNERKGKASGPLRDTSELRGDEDKRAALLDYDEPECVISDDTDLDTKATLHPDDNPLNNSEPVAALFDPHDYAELDEWVSACQVTMAASWGRQKQWWWSRVRPVRGSVKWRTALLFKYCLFLNAILTQ